MTSIIPDGQLGNAAAAESLAELRRIAARLMWWLEPEAALARPLRFLMQVMTLGTWQDVQLVSGQLGWDAFRRALDHAEPGVFDARSWAYWHIFFGRAEPALPSRSLS